MTTLKQELAQLDRMADDLRASRLAPQGRRYGCTMNVLGEVSACGGNATAAYVFDMELGGAYFACPSCRNDAVAAGVRQDAFVHVADADGRLIARAIRDARPGGR